MNFLGMEIEFLEKGKLKYTGWWKNSKKRKNLTEKTKIELTTIQQQNGFLQ